MYFKPKHLIWLLHNSFFAQKHSRERDSTPKMSFSHPQVVPNPYEFLSSAEPKRRYSQENMGYQTIDGHHWLP